MHEVPQLTCSHVNNNVFVFQEGEDPKLKPDSEYPDWLWTLKTERGVVPLEELEYDSEKYWRRLKELHTERKKKLRRIRRDYCRY